VGTVFYPTLRPKSGGVVIFLSSSKSVFGSMVSAVVKHGVEDVSASVSDGDEGLVVAFALGELSVVVGP